jgi:hypothetical protein
MPLARVLAARVHREAQDERLLLAGLRPRVVLLPWPEERCGAVGARGGERKRGSLEDAAA